MRVRTASVAGLLLAAVLASCAAGAEPWDVPFAADAKAVAEAAKHVSAPEGQALVVLLDEQRYSIDREGRVEATLRKVYRLVNAEAVEDWAAVEQSYQPWYQQRPHIRARVIDAEGAAHWLDPKTIAESPAIEFDANIFSDRRVVRGPLPSVGAGAVVEYEILLSDTAPLLDAGTVHRISVEDMVPLQRFHVVVEADKSIPLRTATKLIPDSALRRQSTRKSTIFECDWGPLPLRNHFEVLLPSDVPNSPYLSFSTGGSWEGVAARYGGIVDRQIHPADADPLLAGIDRSQPQADLIAHLVRKLHKQVRYTGVEFGEAAIVPASPAETLRRGYGDCKDKSTLLVAALRSAGLDAHLALLDTGFGADVDSDLPGLGAFDHAIVYVTANPPVWIDATAAETRVGQLPANDQGRLTLITRPGATALVKTPESESKENWERHSIEVRLREYGPGEITETIEAGGTREAMLRSTYGGNEVTNKQRLESHVKQTYAGKLGKFSCTQADDWSGPFKLSFQVTDSRMANTAMDDAAVALIPQLLFSEVPYALREPVLAGEKDEEKKREHDFVFWAPYRIEYRYRIVAPPLFKPASLPPSAELKLGSAGYVRSFQPAGDGAVQVVYQFDTGKRRLTPAEFEAVREGITKYTVPSPDLIAFQPATAEHMAMGRTGKALALVRDYVGQHQDQATAHVRLSRMLVASGLGGAAIEEAKKAVELGSASSQSWQALGWANEHDIFGRRFGNGWNRAEAVRCYRKAREIDPEDHIAAVDLAVLFEHPPSGIRYGAGAELGNAIAIYREVLKKWSHPEIEQSLALDLLYSGQTEAATEQLKKCSGETQAELMPLITAIEKGPAEAIMNAQRAFSDPAVRQVQLVRMALSLIHMRRYDIAQPLIAAAARVRTLNGIEGMLDMLGKIKKHEDAVLPESDPRSPVQQLLVELLLGGRDEERLKPLFTSGEAWEERKAIIDPVRKALSMMRHGYPQGWFTDENIADTTLSEAEMQKDGDDGRGYRIHTTIPREATFPPIYVVLEGGRYKILASGDNLASIGRHVQDLLANNDVKGAQWWLDEVVSELTAAGDGTGFPAVHSLWSGVVPATRGPNAIAVAAASLTGGYSGSSDALRTLRQARLNASTDLERAQIDKAICETLSRAKNWPDLLVAAKRLSGVRLFAEEGFRYSIQAAAGAGNWTELRGLAEQRLKSNPQNTSAMRAVARARMFQGDRKGAADSAVEVTTLSFAGNDERVFNAWGAMVGGKADEKLLASLKEDRAFHDQGYYYAVAMLQAVLKMPEDAQQSLGKALDMESSDQPDARAWAIYGKICEQYGFAKEAQAAYQRARSASRDDQDAEWALALIPR